MGRAGGSVSRGVPAGPRSAEPEARPVARRQRAGFWPRFFPRDARGRRVEGRTRHAPVWGMGWGASLRLLRLGLALGAEIVRFLAR